MRKLAKKVLAICLSAVMAGSLLSAVAFATTAEASSSSNKISVYASGANATVVDSDQEWEDCDIQGDVYIEKGITLTLSGTSVIDGDVFVFGTVINTGDITITGTLYCLHYNSSSSAGDEYDYGYFISSGSNITENINGMDVTADWLDTEIPDTSDGGDNNGESDASYTTCIGVPITITLRRNISIDEEYSFVSSDGAEITAVSSGVGIIIDGGGYPYEYMFSVTMTEIGSHEITATGLTTGASITFTLNVNPHDMVLHPYKAPTCTENGHEEYYQCSVCGRMTSDAEGEDVITEESVEIPALGHTWEEVEWSWSESHDSATASRTCSVCGETETVKATVTSEVLVEPTETKEGEIEYTASATFDDGTTVTDSVTDVYTLADKEKDEAAGKGTDSTGTTGTGSTGTGNGSTGTGSSGNSGTSGSSGTGSTVTSPQTSDSSSATALWMIVACFGLAGCVSLVVYKVHGVKEQN